MKLIGINELAVRLPSAFAAFFTCVILLVFSLKYVKNYWFGFIAVMVLITSQGYIAMHATRTGDYDSLLTFFTTASGLLFFTYCETKKNKHLYLFFLAVTLSVLTKGIAGLLFMPAIAIYCVIQKQFIPLIKNKHFYFGILSFLIPVIGYYVLRESINPGYFDAVQKNELGGRFRAVLDNHTYDFWYYYKNIVGYKLKAWFLLIPCGLAIGLAHKDKLMNKIALYCAFMSFTFLLVISDSHAKLEWYDVPVFPYLALLITVFIYFVFKFLENSKWIQESLKFNIAPYVFLLLIFIMPYNAIIEKTYKPQESTPGKKFYEIGYYLQDAVDGKHDLNGKHFLNFGYNAHNNFYLNILNDRGVNVKVKDYEKLEKDDIVIYQHEHIVWYVATNYVYEELERIGNVYTCKIINRKAN
ncbi:MAG: hypothetical protein HKN75_07195 [Bacteroidia bacterium]|nr:hypothetical protein [Bacteroidia bacterium]